MNGAVQEKCFHHRQREAVARCPECRRFFCRECITEHDDRVVCASCLQAASTDATQRKIRWASLTVPLQFCVGLLLVWLVFYGLGRILTAIPADVHAGSWTETAEEFMR